MHPDYLAVDIDQHRALAKTLLRLGKFTEAIDRSRKTREVPAGERDGHSLALAYIDSLLAEAARLTTEGERLPPEFVAQLNTIARKQFAEARHANAIDHHDLESGERYPALSKLIAGESSP